MEEQRKPTRWHLWLAIGLVLAVSYMASCGPVFMMLRRTGKTSGPAWAFWSAFYWPATKLVYSTPPPVSRFLRWWCGL